MLVFSVDGALPKVSLLLLLLAPSSYLEDCTLELELSLSLGSDNNPGCSIEDGRAVDRSGDSVRSCRQLEDLLRDERTGEGGSGLDPFMLLTLPLGSPRCRFFCSKAERPCPLWITWSIDSAMYREITAHFTLRLERRVSIKGRTAGKKEGQRERMLEGK